MSQVDVTVVVATRNRSDLLREALESIARQSFSNFEVVVVDDGSTAEHAAVYRALLDRFDARFRFLQPVQSGQTGSGPSVSRNRGMDAGSGRYIAFLDDDDTWTWDDHLSVAVEMLDRTRTALYCADMQGFRGDQLVWDTWFPEREALRAGERVRTDPPVYRSTRAAFVKAATHRSLQLNMIVVARQLVERVGGMLPGLRFSEDGEFVLRLADRLDTVLFCEQPIARYRFPVGDSVSLTLQLAEQHLQTLTAAQHLRIVAHSPEVRRAARNLEGWTLRLLSQNQQQAGRPGAAVALALQALVTAPTLGALRQVVRSVLPGRPSQT